MERRIRLDCKGGRIDKIQCPNPSCEEILVIPEEENRHGMIRTEITCPKCGDSAMLMFRGMRRE